LILFPLIVPPLELESSSLGTEKFQEGNSFWNSYVLEREHDTIASATRLHTPAPLRLQLELPRHPSLLLKNDNGRTHYMVSPPALLLSM
ncbi:hypothetical protein, partial [Porphyromonas sp.]|uniref:hypothetical protein n=1 Tax=Porphyromonas sp. TaxID=1924944 RepID=UPI003AB8B83B